MNDKPLSELTTNELRDLYMTCNSRDTQDKILDILVTRPREEYIPSIITSEETNP